MTSLRLAFAGTPDFAARHLAALLATRHEIAAVLTQPDRRAGRGKKAQAGPVKALAEAQSLPVLQPPTLKDPDTQAALRGLQLDALVVVAYGLILPQAVLDIPAHGCITVHESLLPRWRGAAPIQRAIEAGDAESGITIMRMDAGLDTGPMLAKRACPIPPLATSGQLYGLLAELGPALLCEVLDDLPGHLARAEAQDHSLATYAHKIDKGEANIDWSRPAAEIARRIRAFNPAPGCFSHLAGQRVKLWRATAQAGSGGAATPGTVLECSERGIRIACGAQDGAEPGSLLVEEAQVPGARALPAAELLRGRADVLHPGATLQSAP